LLRGSILKDLSECLPKIRVPQDSTIPSAWDNELIVKLLGSVDRSSPKGKRDYAILILASHLGLRVGDIRLMTLDNLKWDTETIEIIQSKTETPLSLPLTKEVGEALIDYLKSGRPKSKNRELFLKLLPPFEPFGENNHLHYIVKYWREIAGIKFRTKQHHGMHSLRHTLATRLLQKETPFHIISEILGHASTKTTMIYAKADVESLRGVALDGDEEVKNEHL
jgi:integrase